MASNSRKQGKNMKLLSRALFPLAAIALVLAFGGSAWAQAPGSPGTGLVGTIHDFTPGTYGTNTQPIGECTFCHTPHRAISTALLWNHTYSGSTYEWDEATTTAGTTYPTFSDNTWNGPTAKCLACHDGTIAIGAVNWFLQGHGLVNANVAQGQLVLNTQTATGLGLVTQNGVTSMSGVHPTAMPYPYGKVANTYNGVTTGPELYPQQWQSPPLGNVRLWQQNGQTISLGYNGSTGMTSPTLTTNAGIECTSCHDVHNKLTIDQPLLVGHATGDDQTYLCNMCHIK